MCRSPEEVVMMRVLLFFAGYQMFQSKQVNASGPPFLSLRFQVGNLPPIQLQLDVVQLLLVVGIALAATFLMGLLVGRVSLSRLFGPLLWSLLGIGIFVGIVPQFWKSDYPVDGLPLFTAILGAFATLIVFHLLLGHSRRSEVAPPPPVEQPPLRGRPEEGVIAAPPACGPQQMPSSISDRSGGTALAPAPVAATVGSVPGVQLLFHSQRVGMNPSLVSELVAFILGTEHSLDCAIYDLRQPEVLQALATVARKQKLRIAFDAGKSRPGVDPKPGGNQEALEAAGLLHYATSIHEGNHLMHNKFLIRDGRTVWTGSANFTQGGLDLQDNNCLIIDAPEVAAQYEATFADLISPDHHHPHARGEQRMGTPVRVGEAVITPDFAPAAGEGIENSIIAALKDVRRLRIMAFLISDAGILAALKPLADDHRVDIRGIYDPNGMEDALRSNRQNRSHFWFLHDSRFVAAPSHAFHAEGEQDFMHNKVLIINDDLVITGSYNFSENAEANDENILRIQSPAIAAAYNSYYDALYAAYSKNPGQLHDHPVQRLAHKGGKRGGWQGSWRSVLDRFGRR
jgi:hypothetical protein